MANPSLSRRDKRLLEIAGKAMEAMCGPLVDLLPPPCPFPDLKRATYIARDTTQCVHMFFFWANGGTPAARPHTLLTTLAELTIKARSIPVEVRAELICAGQPTTWAGVSGTSAHEAAWESGRWILDKAWQIMRTDDSWRTLFHPKDFDWLKPATVAEHQADLQKRFCSMQITDGEFSRIMYAIFAERTKASARREDLSARRPSAASPPPIPDAADQAKQRGANGGRRTRSARAAELLLALFETDRSNLNKSRVELAKKLGVHPGTIGRALRNEKYRPRFEELYREARVTMPTVDEC